MPWQELGESSQADISLDADGYVHLTRVFKVWDVDRPSFFSHLDSITQVGGTRTLPPYGDPMIITLPSRPNAPAYGPFLEHAGATEGNGNDSIKSVAILHQWRLQPSTAAVFFAIADYSNDPRLVPGGIHYRAEQQQAMVSIPYARRSTIAVGAAGVSYGYLEAAFSSPMGVESITHSTVFPRSRLKEAESNIADRVNQLHQLPIKPIKSPCLYLGADIAMRGPQWLDITHRWQWQQGLNNAGAFSDLGEELRYFDGAGNSVEPGPTAALVPHRIKPLNESIFGSAYYIVPPFHEISMMIDYTVNVQGITIPKTLWYYRMPFKASSTDVIAWKSLPGSKNFIWGGGLG